MLARQRVAEDSRRSDSARLQESDPHYAAVMGRAVLKYQPLIHRILDDTARAVFPIYMDVNDAVHHTFEELRKVTSLRPDEREAMVQGDQRRAWLMALNIVIAERGMGDIAKEDALMMEFIEKSGVLVTKREAFRVEAMSKKLDATIKPKR